MMKDDRGGMSPQHEGVRPVGDGQPPALTRRAAIVGTTLGLLAFDAAHARAVPRAVDGRYVRIGGADQWVWTKGDGTADRVLLVVHGGPGEAQSSFVDHYAGAWTKRFTVAGWDQRGSGRSLAAGTSQPDSMTVDRLVADGVEVAAWLRQRFGKPITIVGHSWGSFLAPRIVEARPDLFTAYVGTGQLLSWRRLVDDQLSYARARATTLKATEQERALDGFVAKGRYALSNYLMLRTVLNAYLAPSDLRWSTDMPRLLKIDRSSSSIEKDWNEGAAFSIARLGSAVTGIDLSSPPPRFTVPVTMLQGEQDHVTPMPAAGDFLRSIDAPSKRMKVIPRSGHYAMMTASDEFARYLI